MCISGFAFKNGSEGDGPGGAAAPLAERTMPTAPAMPSSLSSPSSSGRALLIPQREPGCVRGCSPQESSPGPQHHKTGPILAPVSVGGGRPCPGAGGRQGWGRSPCPWAAGWGPLRADAHGGRRCMSSSAGTRGAEASISASRPNCRSVL